MLSFTITGDYKTNHYSLQRARNRNLEFCDRHLRSVKALGGKSVMMGFPMIASRADLTAVA